MNPNETPRCAVCGKPWDDAPKSLCPLCQADVFEGCNCETCKFVREKRKR